MVGADGRLRPVNPAVAIALRALGPMVTTLEPGASLARLADALHPDDRAAMQAALARVTRESDPPVRCVARLRTATGAECWAEWTLAPQAPGGLVTALGQEVTAWRRRQEQLEAELALLHRAASGTPLPAALAALVEPLERRLSPGMVAVSLADPAGAHVRHALAPTVPAALLRALDGAAVATDGPAPLAAAARRAPVVTTDPARDPAWRAHAEVLDGLGIRAAWAWPLVGPSGRLAGAVTVYRRAPAVPTEEERALLEEAAEALAAAIEVHRTREDHQFLGSALARASDLVLVLEGTAAATPGRRILFASGAALPLTGWTPEELVGRTLYGLRGPATDERVLARIGAALDAGEPVRDEVLEVRRDGTPVWLELDFAPHRGADGAVTHWLVVARDVTARRRQEDDLRGREAALQRAADALQASEARFRAVFEHTARALLLLSPDGTVAEANAAALAIAGAGEPAALAGRRLPETAWWPAGADGERLDAALARARDGEDVTLEVTLAPPGRAEVPVQVALHPLRDGVPTGGGALVLLEGVDVSAARAAAAEHRAMEARLVAAQRYESLGALVGGIAHEFNNLLAAIVGNLGLALQELPPGSPALESLREADTGARRAAERVKQMLAYAGKTRSELRPLNTLARLRDAVELVRPLVPPLATLHVDLPAHLPPVAGDPTQLTQVIVGLVSNAIEALRDAHGTVTVRAHEAELRGDARPGQHAGAPLLEPGRYVAIEVGDDGTGMTPEVRARIFDPFFSTKFMGRGLGLSAALGIVRAHGGTIDVESEPGSGTTMTVLLPALPIATPVEPPPAPATGPANGRHPEPTGLVVVADDEPAVRSIAQRLLRRYGYESLAAADGREALDLVLAHDRDVALLLLDMTMPRMGGLETLAELRRLDIRIPVLLSSGFSEEEIGPHLPADLRGAVGFVQKPYTPVELVAAIRRIVGIGAAS